MCIGGGDPKDTKHTLRRSMTFFSAKKAIYKPASLRPNSGLVVNPRLIENIQINDGAILQETVVGKSLNAPHVSAIEIAPTDHSDHIRERAAGATGADGNPDFSKMTREQKKEYVQNLLNEIFDAVDSPLLDGDEPAVDPEALAKFTGNLEERGVIPAEQNDPGNEGGGDEPKPVNEENGGENGGGNADSDDSGGGFWDWLVSLFSDDDEAGDDAGGDAAGVDQSSENPMNDHQGGGEPDGGTGPQDINEDINYGPDGKNDDSGESDFGTFDVLDPITNWGPDGKPGHADVGVGIGIGIDDPHTNWGGEQYGDEQIKSILIDVLGDINPDFNVTEDISAKFVHLISAIGSDLF